MEADPNFITMPLILVGFVMNYTFYGWFGVKSAFLGLLIGGGFFLLLYMAGAMGAGDVKLMGGIGTFLGQEKILTVLFLTILAGGIMAIFKILSMELRQLYAATPKKGTDIQEKRTLLRSSKETLPYGIAIAIGSIITLLSNNY